MFPFRSEGWSRSNIFMLWNSFQWTQPLYIFFSIFINWFQFVSAHRFLFATQILLYICVLFTENSRPCYMLRCCKNFWGLWVRYDIEKNKVDWFLEVKYFYKQYSLKLQTWSNYWQHVLWCNWFIIFFRK